MIPSLALASSSAGQSSSSKASPLPSQAWTYAPAQFRRRNLQRRPHTSGHESSAHSPHSLQPQPTVFTYDSYGIELYRKKYNQF